MDNNLLQKLKDWRRGAANLEGVEAFQVFANTVLENIAELKPSNRDEIMAIKGIKDKKFAKYGEEVLGIINNNGEYSKLPVNENQTNKPLSVSRYLDFLNREMVKLRARIQGEISSIDIREKVIYFSLKDSEDGSVISCLIWKSNYEISGIKFEAGIEVILEGTPDVYKSTGRLSFKTSSVELVGEGALKKAYDQLKKKLYAEGLLSKERKRAIPTFPQKIGVITSRQGAVLADFLSNIGNYGFKIIMIDSRVEGQSAVADLLLAVRTMKKKDIEVLVIMRGGGSFESLQSFNNEFLVREIASFTVPVIAAIGHDKDAPLVSLAADFEVSTPSIAATTLSKSWKEAIMLLEKHEDKIVGSFEKKIADVEQSIRRSMDVIYRVSNSIIEKYKIIRNKIDISFQNFKNNLSNTGIVIDNSFRRTVFGFKSLLSATKQKSELKISFSVFQRALVDNGVKVDDYMKISIDGFKLLFDKT
ncbi:MAG: exodeoxyribonuclease VII large subunit, partial [Candidatus Staskawiczbacteria bacterium RIFOXYC2_FULL_32_10]